MSERPDLAAIRGYHPRLDVGLMHAGWPTVWCNTCDEGWPCDMTVVLDYAERLEAELAMDRRDLDNCSRRYRDLAEKSRDWAAAAQARAERAEARAAELEAALAETVLPLEALYMAEHDGRALAPATKAAIRDGIMAARRALAAGQDASRRRGAV